MKNIFSLIFILATAACSLSGHDKTQDIGESAASAQESVHGQAQSHAEHSDSHEQHAMHLPEGLSADKGLQYLKNGNTRFLSNKLRKDGQSKQDVEKLVKGQKPHSIVLSCSDSRLPPEVVFDQKLCEIFVVRSAGEVIEPTEIGSMEYAVEHLGTRNLVVMGHTKCGAVTAAFQTLDGKDAGTPNLNILVRDIHPRIAQFKGKEPSHHFEAEAWANVDGIVSDLMERSALLKAAVNSGEVKIRKAMYYMDSGKVEFKD